jgi:hypothetical protein
LKKAVKIMSCLTAMVTASVAGSAQEPQPDAAAELAKKLANPVASLISVPLQYNYDDGFGPGGNGSKSVLNVQPVIPFSMGDDWNLITRTIIPLIDQQDIPPGVDKSGVGDITQSFFFSPKKPVSGWILAAGPVFLYPAATDDLLGSEKWGAGPTALALKQTGPWTAGILANHIESFAGNEDRENVSTTFVQPFLSYITKTKTTFGLNTESTYDWNNDQWSVPVNATVAQLLKIGSQIIQLGGGIRYWAESPENGPDGIGFRVTLTFLFPK